MIVILYDLSFFHYSAGLWGTKCMELNTMTILLRLCARQQNIVTHFNLSSLFTPWEEVRREKKSRMLSYKILMRGRERKECRC